MIAFAVVFDAGFLDQLTSAIDCVLVVAANNQWKAFTL